MPERMNMHFSKRLSLIVLLVSLIGTNILSVGCSLTTAALPELPPTSGGRFAITTLAGLLANAFIGSPYPQVITTTLANLPPGGTAPLTSCTVISGSLPPGLMVVVDPTNPNQCAFTGIPMIVTPLPAGCTAGGVAGALFTCSFTLRVTDSSIPSLSDTEDFRIPVLAGFSITTTVLEDAVAGRAYQKTINTNVGLLNAQGVPQGTAPLTLCQFSSTDSAGNPLSTPPGMGAGNIAIGVSTDGRANAACIINYTPAAGVSGTFMFRLITEDNSNPTNTRDAVYTLTIRNEWAITPFTVVDGILNRPYSKTFTLTTNLQNNGTMDVGQAGEPGNGPVDNSNFMAVDCGGAFTGLPAGITASCVLDPSGTSVTVTLSGTPTATGANMSMVTLQDSVIPDSNQPCPDTVNMPMMQCPSATPVVPAGPQMSSFGFFVRNEFTITPFTVVDGIVNRPYSKTFTVTTDLSNNPATTPPDVNNNENGNGPLTACSFINLPAGIMTSSCTVDASGTSVTVTLSGTPTAVGQVTSTIMLTDTDIFQPPQVAPVVAQFGQTFDFTFTVRDEYAITPFTVVDGVVNRPYSKTFTVTTNLSVNANDVGQAGEFGNGPLTACVFSGLPSGISATSCVVDPGGTSVTVTLAGMPTAVGQVTSRITLTDTDILQPPQAAPVVAKLDIFFDFQFTIRQEFSITEPNLVDAIFGRMYTKSIATDLLNVPGPSDVGQTAELGNGPIVSCTETTGALAGVGLAIGVDPADASRCQITGTVTAGAGTTIMITVQVVDTQIDQPPQVAPVVNGGMVQRSYPLTIRGEFSITEPSVVDAVSGRSYTKHINTDLLAMAGPSDVGQAAEFGNGPSTACAATIDGNAVPFGGFMITTETNGCRLSTAATVTLAAGSYALDITVTDNDILQNAAIVVMGSPITRSYTLVVRPDSTFVTTTVVDGIQSRNYLKTLTTDKNNPTPTGAGNVATCALSGTPPPSLSAAVAANNLDCVLSASPLADPPGVYNFIVTATDSDITQLNSSTGTLDVVVAGGMFSQAFTITVRAEFNITEPFVVDAINGRAYTKHINTSLIDVDPGVDIGQAAEFGNGPPATCFADIDGNNLPFGGFTIAVDPATNGCRLMAGSVTLAPGSYNLNFGVRDNDITQFEPRSGTNPIVVGALVRVAGPYTLVVRADSTFVTTTVVDAITGRDYTKTLVTDKNNPNPTGAGNVVNCALSGTPPGGLTVAPAANGLDCELSANPIADAPGTYNFTVTATDDDITQLNSSTGNNDIVVAGGNFSQAYTLVVRDEFTFLTGSLVDGVEGRSYTKVVETNLTSMASDVGQTGEFGNGPIQAGSCVLDALTPSDPLPTGLGVADHASNLHCQIAGAIGAGQGGTFFGTTNGIILAVTDTPILQLNPRTGVNETVVPANTILSVVTPFQLYVRFPLAFELTVSPCGPTGTCPVAVKGRTYNVAGGIAREVDLNTIVTGGDVIDFSVTAGPFTLAAGTWTGNAGTSCEGFTIDSGSGFLNGGPTGTVAGVCSFTVTLNDKGIDQASVNFGLLNVVPPTPPGDAMQAFNIEVQPEMTIVNAPPLLPGGLKDSPYTVSLTVVNGLSTTTGPVNLPAIVEWTIVDGAFFMGGAGVPGTPCEGLTIIDLDGTSANQGATISGTPVMAGDCGPFTIQVTDNGNEPGVANFVANGLITQDFTIVINDSLAFVSNNSAPFVRVIRTDTDSATAFIYPLTFGGDPQGIALNPADTLLGYVTGNSSGFVESFCTRVSLPECPVAFAPPVGVPATISAGPGLVPDVTIPPAPTTFFPDTVFGLFTDNTNGLVWFFQAKRNSAFAPLNTFFGSPQAPGTIPGAQNLSVRPQSDFVWVTSSLVTDTLFELDINSAAIGFTFPLTIPGSFLTDVAVSPDGRFVYATDGNGLVHVVDSDPASPTYRTVIAVTPAAGAGGGLLGGAFPVQIAFAPDGRFAYVTDYANNVVAAIDPATLVGGSILVTNNSISLSGGLAPVGIALTDDSRKAFVANNGDSSVTSIDTDATPSATFQMPLTNFNGAGNFVGPFGVATMPDPHLHILNPVPTGIAGAAYDFTVVAAGGTPPYSFSAVGLPAPLMMDAAGRITGVPADPGVPSMDFMVTVTVTDGSVPVQTDVRTIILTIKQAGALLPGTVVDAIDGRTYTNAIATGLPFLVLNPGGMAGSLNTADMDCTGLSISSTGVISGTAGIVTDAVCDFTVELRDGMNNLIASQMYSLTIRQEFDVTAFTVVDGIINRPYSKTFTISTNLSNSANETGQAAEFGNGPVTTCMFSGLPAGISATSCTVDPGGTTVTATLAGIPTAAGSFMSTVTLMDSNLLSGAATVVPQNMRSFMFGFDVRNEYSITSVAPVPATAFNNQPYGPEMFTVTTDLSVNVNDVGQFGAEVGNGPVANCVVTGSLPNGLMAVTTFAGMTTCTVTIIGTPNLPAMAFPAMFPLMVVLTDSDIFQPPQAAPVVSGVMAAQAFTIIVDKTGTTTTVTMDTPDPSVFGQDYTVMLSVASTGGTAVNPTGDVTVADTFGNMCMATLTPGNPSTGMCDLPSNNVTAPGTLDITATYPGDVNFYGSDNTAAPEAHTVNKADTTTTITADSPDPSAVNLPVSVSFTVAPVAPGAGIPTGMVTVSDGVDNCMFTLTLTDNGMGSCMITLTTTGMRNLTADYVGDANFNASMSAMEPHQVLTVALVPFTLANGSVSTASVPRTYQVDITILGMGATGCSDSGTLPAGLTVALVAGTPDVCRISDMPTATFSGMVSISVTDGVDTDTKMAALTITAALTIVQDTGMDGAETLSPDAVSQQTYTQAFTASGGQPMFSFAQMGGATLADDADCGGLTFMGTTMGSLAGTPTAAGSFPITCTFTIQVTDSDTFSTVDGVMVLTSPAATYELDLTLNIGDPLTITTTATVNALRNSAYNPTGTPAGQTLTTLGGSGVTYTWSITGGAVGTLFNADASMPPNFVGMAGTACEGLTLNGTGPSATTGLIQGTGVNAGTCGPFTVQVDDPGDGMAIGPGMDTQDLSIQVLNTFAYVADPTNNQVNVINTTSDMEAGTIDLSPTGSSMPRSIAVRKDGARAYVTMEMGNELAIIDTTNNSLVGTGFALAGCTGPRGIAVGTMTGGATDNSAYIACSNDTVLKVDVSTDALAITATITNVAKSDGTGEPNGIALTPDESKLYVAVSDRVLCRIATSTNTRTCTDDLFAGGTSNEHVVVSANGTLAYFTDSGNDDVRIVNVAADTVNTVINLFAGLDPSRLARDPDTGRVFISMRTTGQLNPDSGGTGATTGFFTAIDADATTITGGKQIVVGNNNADRAGGTTTITFTGQPFIAGDIISVSGMSAADFDGIYTVDSASANSFTYLQPGRGDNSNEQGATIALLVAAGTTAPNGLTAPPTNSKVYLAVTSNVARRDDVSPFGNPATIPLTGAGVRAGMAHIPIPK